MIQNAYLFVLRFMWLRGYMGLSKQTGKHNRNMNGNCKMQYGITTKYHGPNNTKGARYHATVYDEDTKKNVGIYLGAYDVPVGEHDNGYYWAAHKLAEAKGMTLTSETGLFINSDTWIFPAKIA